MFYIKHYFHYKSGKTQSMLYVKGDHIGHVSTVRYQVGNPSYKHLQSKIFVRLLSFYTIYK